MWGELGMGPHGPGVGGTTSPYLPLGTYSQQPQKIRGHLAEVFS